MRFMDLCAGIGGFRIGMESAGHECVLTAEWDFHARMTYRANFSGEILGDVWKIDVDSLPECDVVCAGFPCQAFSMAGRVQKTERGEVGFDDEVKGQVFFAVARVIEAAKPKYVLLENVRGLLSCDEGRAFATIRQKLEDLGYNVDWKVINAKIVVPQSRIRVFIVCTRRGFEPYEWPDLTGDGGSVRDILEDGPREWLSEREWGYYTTHRDRRLARGAVGWGTMCHILDLDRPCRTILANYGKNPECALIGRGEGLTPGRLTVSEVKKVMGFPEQFRFPVSDTVAYRQLGNAVVPPVVARLAKQFK